MEARGTGSSPRPPTARGYAATCLADDLEDLRLHLGLGEMDVIAHSAGCAVAFLAAAAHPDRVSRLVLLTPSTRALEMTDTDEEWESQQAKRRDEPWFTDAVLGNAGIIRELMRYVRLNKGDSDGYAVQWPDHPGTLAGRATDDSPR